VSLSLRLCSSMIAWRSATVNAMGIDVLSR
jgi:hypothetical protein